MDPKVEPCRSLQVPDLPWPIRNAVGTSIGNSPVLCGGRQGNASSDLCWTYRVHRDMQDAMFGIAGPAYKGGEWLGLARMSVKRDYAAAVKLSGERLWITGKLCVFKRH